MFTPGGGFTLSVCVLAGVIEELTLPRTQQQLSSVMFGWLAPCVLLSSYFLPLSLCLCEDLRSMLGLPCTPPTPESQAGA